VLKEKIQGLRNRRWSRPPVVNLNRVIRMGFFEKGAFIKYVKEGRATTALGRIREVIRLNFAPSNVLIKILYKLDTGITLGDHCIAIQSHQ
jgi:hypothetical protein